jgi:hypothetical protein
LIEDREEIGKPTDANLKIQVSNWIVAFTTPILLARSTFAVYFFFGFSSLITVLVCAIIMPETKGYSLEAIDQAFLEHSGSVTWASQILEKIRRKKMNGGGDGGGVEIDVLRGRPLV